MRVEIYSYEERDLLAYENDIPDMIRENVCKPGFFTIGAMADIYGEETGVGLLQFYIDMKPDGEVFADLYYVYVPKEQRHHGVGTRLTDKLITILKKSDIKTCIACVPDQRGDFLSIPGKDFESFLSEQDFFEAGKKKLRTGYNAI